MSKEGETLRVLILEDDPTISMALEAFVEDAVSAVILVGPSVALNARRPNQENKPEGSCRQDAATVNACKKQHHSAPTISPR